MVLAERNSDNLRNGRRSRGPSPNGHATESSSDGESIGEGGTRSLTHGPVVPEEKIRVGRDYQAICPGLLPVADRRPDQVPDKALLVWSPTINIPDLKLDEYICLAKEKYGYNGEQALGMLFWHKHDLERAIMDLSNFTPFPDEWTVEDKVLFEQAFQFHGKSFHRIRQMLPDKTIASLVKYYYSWKKTRTRTSLMDRQARKLATNRDEGSEVGSEHGSNTDSDGEEKVKLLGGKNVLIEGHVTNSNDDETGKLIKSRAVQNSEKSFGKLVSTVNSSDNLKLESTATKNLKRPSLGNGDGADVKPSPRKRLCLLDRPAPRIIKLNRAFKRAETANNERRAMEEATIEKLTEESGMNITNNSLSDPVKTHIQIASTA